MKIWFRMAESLSEIFERLLAKQQILVERYAALENKLKAANEKIIDLEASNLKYRQQIEKLEQSNEYLRIARAIAPDKESLDKGRQLIAKLVRDVDKCIEQLNE